jgi:hypothetical protein
MGSLAIVEALDVVEHILSSLGSGSVSASMDPLTFEEPEEAFDHSIVVAVANPAHRTLDSVFGEQGLEVATGVLAATIRVVQEHLARIALPERHQQRA